MSQNPGEAMRLLLVEDNDELSALLARSLHSAGFDADIATTAAGAIGALGAPYSAVILDLGLPDDDGLVVLSALRSAQDATPVIILTARDGVGERVAGLMAGADDYLVKPFAIEELVARLEAVLRRPGQLLERSLALGNLVFDSASRQLFVGGAPQTLPARELAILEILLRRGGRVVSKRLVEDQLFGLSVDVGSNAIEVYIHRLRKLLQDAGANAVIHTIRGVGYLLTAD